MLMVLFSFFLFVGPVMGYWGAMRLQRNKLAVYLAFQVPCFACLRRLFRQDSECHLK